MITLRRNTERRHLQHGKHDVWLTFYRERLGPRVDDFGILATLDEIGVPQGNSFATCAGEEAELVTYVYKGALAQEDSTGSSGVLHAGEFQRMITRRGIRQKETNVSRADRAHVFRISLRPSEVGLGCAREQKRFAVAQRHNVLCPVASPDGRQGSLRILQDALIYSSELDAGHHLVHELLPGRSAWLHVICGEVTLLDVILGQGDGVGVTNEPSVSLTAQGNSEILLVDLGSTPRSFAGKVVSGSSTRTDHRR
jgi:hypothetical protein